MTSRLRRNWHILVAVLVLSAVIVPLIPAGLGSGDGWGIIHSTNVLVHEGRFQVSRPPGHPTTEFLFLPALALALSRVGIGFGPAAYLTQLWLVAVAGVVFFLLLLGRLGVSRRDSLVACAALIATPSFLDEAVDGDEMLWGLSLVLGSWLILVPFSERADRSLSAWRLVGAALVLALAVGARPEVGVMALPMIWVLSGQTRRPGQAVLLFALTFGVALVLLWLPVLMAHSELRPFDLPTDWRLKIKGAAYKNLFTILPFPASIILWTGFLATVVRMRRPMETHERRFIEVVWIVPVMFSLLFFLYPTKPGFCLPGVAFLLLVLAVAQRRAWLVAGLAALVLALIVRVDVFRDRVFVGPVLAEGVWSRTLRDKTTEKLGDISRALVLAKDPRTVVVVEPLETELDWLVQRHLVPLQRTDISGGAHLRAVYKADVAGTSGLVSRQAMDTPAWFEALASKGYRFFIDAETFRGRWTPYATHESVAGEHVSLPMEDGSSVDCILY